MSQMSRLDLARALCDINAQLPIVISTGFISEYLRDDVEAAGVDELMRKEYTLDDLAAMVEHAPALRGSRSGRHGSKAAGK